MCLLYNKRDITAAKTKIWLFIILFIFIFHTLPIVQGPGIESIDIRYTIPPTKLGTEADSYRLCEYKF